jgi:hypothetical protein
MPGGQGVADEHGVDVRNVDGDAARSVPRDVDDLRAAG